MRSVQLPLRRRASPVWLSCFCIFWMPGIAECEADGAYALESLSLRARLSEKTVLGREAPENFKAYDASANFTLPWKNPVSSSWSVGTRVMASAGLLRGSGENAMVLSLVPELTLSRNYGWLTVDIVAGGALFSEHRFGRQDFGGPFQFALTLGVGVPIYKRLGVAYRFLHYSDAGLNGSGTTGADFHMIEFSYQY
jgi:hypothetical protein